MFVYSAEAQWNQNYLWPSSEIRSLSVLNDNIIWTKDFNDSKISYTIDGGLNWTSKNLPITWNYQEGGICAVNATTVYNIVCQGPDLGLYKTVDAGTTWTKQNAFNSTSTFPDIVYFWNENEGVTIGDGNSNLKYEIYTTSNGGNTWNPVPASSMPTGPTDYTYNTNNVFKVHANTIYFLTNFGKIMKSTNKGISWSEITTPLISPTGASFDFKDDLNGILTYNNSGQFKVYNTSDGGNTWTQISTPSCIGAIRYSQANNAYLSANYYNGYSYSTDNGLTWIQNQTFNKVGLGMIDVTSTGKVFIGGLGSVFSTDNYLSENIAIHTVAMTGYNTIDVSYTKVPYLQNSIDTTNYQIIAIRLGKASKVLIKTISQDVTDKTLMHLTMDNNLPSDSIRITIKNIYDLIGMAKGNPMMYNEPGISTYFKNYSTSKTINVTTPGTLSSFFTTLEKKRITQLTVMGTIDARDFRIMRDSLTALNVLDISATTIAAYTGIDGTYNIASTAYIANELPRQAFYNKTTIVSIILPNSTTSIARSVFNNCQSITSIVIPNGVNSIGQYAFLNCIQLSNISIPNSVTAFGYGAFQYCTLLTQISLPAYLTTISDYCFRGSALTSLSLPASVTSIGNWVFNDCKSLTAISVNSLNSFYSSINGVLFDKNGYTLIRCPEGKTESSYVIPSTVTTISDFAFENTTLTTVSLPSSVSSIGTGTFRNSSITSIFIPRQVSNIGSYPFYNCSNLTSITVDALNLNFISVNGVLFNNTLKTLLAYPPGLAGSYVIPNGATTIGVDAFGSCNKLTMVKIPGSVTAINDYAFEYCTLLTDFTIPSTVKSLGSGVFSYCTSLVSIRTYSTIPIDLSNSYYVFDQIIFCTLYVPNGTKAAYQVANQWSDFINIVEFDPTAVENPKNTNLNIIYNQATGSLQLNGIDSSASVSLYDLNGRLCINRNVKAGEIIALKSLPRGMYVIKAVVNEEVVTRKILF